METALSRYDPALGALPSAATPVWSQGGGTHTLVAERLVVVSTDGPAFWQRPLFGDLGVSGMSRVGPARAADRFEVQVVMRATSFAAIGAVSSPLGIVVSDGVRWLGLAIGSALELVDPSTGDILVRLAQVWNYGADHAYLLRKDGTGRWVVQVDEVVYPPFAYGGAPAAPSIAPFVRWGHWQVDAGSASSSSWGLVETGLNLAVPKAWRVARIESSLTPLVNLNLGNPRWKAWLRATVGLFEDLLDAIAEAWSSVTAATKYAIEFDAAGDVLPTAVVPAWTLNNPSGWSTRRQRHQITTIGTTANTYAKASFVAADPFYVDPHVHDDSSFVVAAATWQLVGGAVDFIAGPYIEIRDYTGTNPAAMMVTAGDSSHYWALVTAIEGDPTVVGNGIWPVNPYEEHRVELWAFGHEWVLLVIDGVPVDRAEWALFEGGDDSESGARIGVWDAGVGPATNITTYAADLRAALGRSDLGSRPLFSQRAIERLIFRGGCDRNDEVDVWVRNRYGVHGARGTERLLAVELQRLCCSAAATAIVELQPADWYLGITYPPVYLGVAVLDIGSGTEDDVVVDVAAEFTPVALFTIDEFGALLAKYLLPMSTREIRYAAWLATQITNVASGGATWNYTVVDVTGFAADDVVVLHQPDNDSDYFLTLYTARIDSVDVGAGLIKILKLDGPAAVTGWTIRRQVAATY